MCISAVVKSFLVQWCSFVKRVFVTGNLRESIINRLGDVVDDARWVIRFSVDVKWCVVGLGIGHVFTV